MTHAFVPDASNEVQPGIYATPIAGLWFLTHKTFPDERGFYAELSRIPELLAIKPEPFIIKQLNLSHSKTKVIRGFHAENWNKLLSVVQGSCFCAWVDVRPDSPTFGDVVTMNTGVTNPTGFGSMFVSAGIANSFCVTDGPVSYLYAVDQLYAERDPQGDVAISLFDPDLAVQWPFPKEELVISARDLTAQTMKERFPSFTPHV